MFHCNSRGFWPDNGIKTDVYSVTVDPASSVSNLEPVGLVLLARELSNPTAYLSRALKTIRIHINI